MTSDPLFFIQREGNVAGPYDVVQLAGLLRRKIITGDTPTRREDEDHWKPLSWQPQYSIVREMPADAVSTRVAKLEEEAGAANASTIMLPSRETLLKLAGLMVGVILAGLASFLIARLDTTTGYGLLIVGVSACAVAYCFILARVLDEDYLTLGAIWFIPGYDMYYMATNIWTYFPWLCVKYLGAAVAIGAALGLKIDAAQIPH